MKVVIDMEEQNGQMSSAPVQSYEKRMWDLWGPIVIKIAIGIGVSMIASIALAIVYVAVDPEAVKAAAENEDKMTELYTKIYEIYYGFSSVIDSVAALITIPVMLYFFHKDRLQEQANGVIPNKKAPVWQYAAGIVMALALCLGLNNLIVISNLSSVSETYQETMTAFYTAPMWLQVLYGVILAPICEELVFRGLLFKRLRRYGTFVQAMLYSGMVFGLMHMNLVQMLYGFILGVMLAYLYEKYGSIKAPIAAHMAMNLLSVLATKYEWLDYLAADAMRIGIATVICAAVASTMFVLIQRIDERPEQLGDDSGFEENENSVSDWQA